MDEKELHDFMRTGIRITGNAIWKARETGGDVDEIKMNMAAACDEGTYQLRDTTFSVEELDTLRFVRRGLQTKGRPKGGAPCSTMPSDFAGGTRW